MLDDLTEYEETIKNAKYDSQQEIANTGFGDMLHDTERNQKYFIALRKVIKQMHDEGREVHVLDIGTGTGILSMMAVEAGAESVTACEAFLPMADCTEKILKRNKMHKKIKLIKKNSVDIVFGVDMPRKANLLVAELLDTELIGEGAIHIYNHAHKYLLTDDVVCIPSSATCYAQVVQSSLINEWSKLKLFASLDGEVLLEPTMAMKCCTAANFLHDVQLSQLPVSSFQPITDPTEIFHFDFNSKKKLETERQASVQLKSLRSDGIAEFIFYWWEIAMEPSKKLNLSCAPFWAHPESKPLSNRNANLIPWRDHWMQAIYYLPKPLRIYQKAKEFVLQCNHDEFSLWFDVFPEAPTVQCTPKKPFCTCGLHMAFSRSRIGQMNQSIRNKRFLQILEQISTKESHIIFFGDGSLFGLAAAKLGAASALIYQQQPIALRFLESMTAHNNIENVRILDKDTLEHISQTDLDRITHIFIEPYFIDSILPWDNLVLQKLLLALRSRLRPEVQLFPRKASMYAVPVEFLNLHKTRLPVGNCEGFDLTLFDKMVESSVALTRKNEVEAEPLWEYPCIALAHPTEILTIELASNADDSNAGVITLEAAGTCNGIVIWIDWDLLGVAAPKHIITTGPRVQATPGNIITWDMYLRQGVYFFKRPACASESYVRWSVKFNCAKSKVDFGFELCKNEL